jgi:hypothetical protein
MRRLFFLAAAAVVITSAARPQTSHKDGAYGLFSWYSPLYLQSDQAFHSIWPHEGGAPGFEIASLRLGVCGGATQQFNYSLGIEAMFFPNGRSLEDGFPENTSLYDLVEGRGAQFRLDDAWIRLGGVLAPGLDLTVGRQRTPWGSAPRFGVLDELNPPDFARFLTFDPERWLERRPQSAVRLDWRAGWSCLQIVLLLQRQEAPLPRGFLYLLQGSKQGPLLSLARGWEDENGEGWGLPNFGIRWTSRFSPLELSLSYYHGNYSLPVMEGWNIDRGPTSRFAYARQDVLGADAAVRIGPLRLWGEAGLVRPEKREGYLEYLGWDGGNMTFMRYHFPLFQVSYLKHAGGLEAAWGAVRVGAGWLHGMVDEIGLSDEARDAFGTSGRTFFGPLNDYLTGRFAWGDEKSRARIQADLLAEVGQDAEAVFLLPELSVRTGLGLRLRAGAFIVLAPENPASKLGLFSRQTSIFGGLSAAF